MGAAPSPDLLSPRSVEDVRFGSGIQFLPQLDAIICSVSMHDPYGIHNTWLSPSSLGLSSSEMANLKFFRAASHIGPMTSSLSRG